MARSYLLVESNSVADRERLGQLSVDAVIAYMALWRPETLSLSDQPPALRDVADLPSDPAALAIGQSCHQSVSALIRSDLIELKSRLIIAEPDSEPESLLPPAVSAAESFEGDAELRRGFADLSFAYLGLQVVYGTMNGNDPLDAAAFFEQVRNAVESFMAGDKEAADADLAASFDALHNARMSAYPATISWIEYALMPPKIPVAAALARVRLGQPVNVIATGSEIERFSHEDAAAFAVVAEAVQNGVVEVLGSTHSDSPIHLLPATSALFQFSRAAQAYERALHRPVDVFASRTGQLHPEMPQLLSKLGFRYGVHAAFDGSRHPQFREPRVQWTAADGTSLETVSRTPSAADPARPLAAFADLGRSIARDYSAVVATARWFGQQSFGLDRLLSVQRRADVFGKFSTVSEFFLSSALPYGSPRTHADEYASVESKTTGVSLSSAPDRWIGRFAARCAFDRLHALAALLSLASGSPSDDDLTGIEEAVETGVDESAKMAETQSRLESGFRNLLAREKSETGFLIVNPTAYPRRICVRFDSNDAMDTWAIAGPIKAVQRGSQGGYAVVDAPAFGFSWLGGTESPTREPPRESASASRGFAARLLGKKETAAPIAVGRRLANEHLEAEIDPRTGGLRGVWSRPSGYSRLGQQLVGPGGEAAVVDSIAVGESGPAYGEIIVRGKLRRPESKAFLAEFRQRFSLWAARPVLEIDIEFDRLPTEALGEGRLLACRWAWPDDKAKLLAADGFSISPHRRGDFETPILFELRERNLSTAVFPLGLPFHRRVGSRMADTLLVAAGSTTRRFRLAVGLDLANPWSIVDDLTMPPLIVECPDGRPKGAAAGWFAQLAGTGIRCVQVRPIDGQASGMRLGLLETTGQAQRVSLRFCRNPTQARLVNPKGEMLFDVFIDGDTVKIDFSAHELLFVELVF